MSPLSQNEVNKLSLMYEGDKSRDASSNIRGFLYQDYITINCLLQPGVEYVCSEYLEDVDVFFENGRFEFIQVKYYPRTTPDMKAISTDLYYQYLRIKMLDSGLTAVPKLYIHRTPEVEKPNLDRMETYIGCGVLPDTVAYPGAAEAADRLRTAVHSVRNKEAQKQKLFETAASKESLQAFWNDFEITSQLDIVQYRQNLMNTLGAAYPNPDADGDEENWRLILLGLAITYIQRRYTLVDPDFEQLRVDRQTFDRYIAESVQALPERTIASYLVGRTAAVHEWIVQYNELTDLQLDMLERIHRNTVRWLGDLCAKVEGQYRLLNTLSRDEARKIAAYQGKTVSDRLLEMAENGYFFDEFLKYLWKIMLNICQDKGLDPKELDSHGWLFDPEHYIVSSVKDYICLNFPEDRYASRSVILPPAGGGVKGVKRRIMERMMKMPQKPDKWFFENFTFQKGRIPYRYSVADVSASSTVACPEESGFYIECMQCIHTDEGDWNEKEDCGKCIFAAKCVNGGDR